MIKSFVTTIVLALAAYGAWVLIEAHLPEEEYSGQVYTPDPLPLAADPAVYIEPVDADEEVLQRVWMRVNAGELPPPVEIDG